MEIKLIPALNDSEIVMELLSHLHSELESVYGKGRIEDFIDENNQMI
jgi:hypothetical protein